MADKIIAYYPDKMTRIMYCHECNGTNSISCKTCHGNHYDNGFPKRFVRYYQYVIIRTLADPDKQNVYTNLGDCRKFVDEQNKILQKYAEEELNGTYRG